jgi:hypothetical protein
VAKDPDDRGTKELPFPESPLQALMNVLRRRDRTPYEIESFIEKAERHGRRTGDLQMLIGVRDWRRRRVLVSTSKP